MNKITDLQTSIKSYLKTVSDNHFQLIIEPLLPGFGYTLGNSLRRVFLSSIPGFAITKIKIGNKNGYITHEYQPLKGVVEDALDIILNIKAIRPKINTSEETVSLSLKKTGGGDVFASDFGADSRVDILNKDLYLCSLDKNGEIEIEIEISRGFGYLPLEKIKLSDNPNPQDILVDAVFSPIQNISIDVEQVRVKDMTNFDKLTLDFYTDNTVEHTKIVENGMELVVDLFQKILSSFRSAVGIEVKEKQEESPKIDLPSKILNILDNNEITDNETLQKKFQAKEIANLPGIGEKEIKEIENYLKKLD